MLSELMPIRVKSLYTNYQIQNSNSNMQKYTLLFSEPVKKLPKGYRHSDSEDSEDSESESDSEEPRGRGRPKASSKSKYLLN